MDARRGMNRDGDSYEIGGAWERTPMLRLVHDSDDRDQVMGCKGNAAHTAAEIAGAGALMLGLGGAVALVVVCAVLAWWVIA